MSEQQIYDLTDDWAQGLETALSDPLQDFGVLEALISEDSSISPIF
jgi:hypothetical protein